LCTSRYHYAHQCYGDYEYFDAFNRFLEGLHNMVLGDSFRMTPSGPFIAAVERMLSADANKLA
jgi:hypothetical protein